MSETLLALMQATREDVAAMRQEIVAGRQETARLASEVARLAAQEVAARRDLDRHREDDRRAMAELADSLAAHGEQIGSLRRWRSWLTGAIAALGLVVSMVAVPLVAQLVAQLGGG